MEEISKEIIQNYAEEFTSEVKVASLDTGDDNQTQMLVSVKDALGDTKLLDQPCFFTWKYELKHMYIELNGYDIDKTDNSITIFAVDFSDRVPCHPVLKDTVDKLGRRALNFVTASLFNSKLLKGEVENQALDFFDEIQEMDKTPEGISKVRIIIVSNGVSSLRKRESKASIPEKSIDVEFILWDMYWIYENCATSKEHEEISIDFKDEETSKLIDGGLPFLLVPQADESFDCYQCVVPGRLLSNIYRKYGSPLLEGNVRSFLTSKTAVNKKIQQTIQKEPKRFYVYNNGIAAVASSVEIEKFNGNNVISRINDIQIINGGQTTASLAYAERKRSADLSDIFVPMKLTIIKPRKDENQDINSLIQKISETSNSQNKVSDADFFANHPFHSLMKKISLDTPVKGLNYNTYWFYERTRGEYQQEMMFKNDNQKKNFLKTHPKEMYLTKTDFAKFVSLLEARPDVASKGSGSNFNDFAKRINKDYEEGKQSKYNEVFFKEITSVARIYRVLEKSIVPSKQTWFGGSYRANVLNYAISLFFYLIKEQYPDKRYDLTMIFDRGCDEDFGIYYALFDQLIDLCRFVYFQLTSDERSVENVTQWAKQAKCWDFIKNKAKNIKLSEEKIKKYLKNTTEVLSLKKDAKENAIITDDNEMYKIVCDSHHFKVWVPLHAFVNEHLNSFSDFTSLKRIIIGKMKNMVYGNGTPSAYECRVALEILEEAELLGFKI